MSVISPALASRSSCLALALFYVGSATELPFHLIDAVLPSFKAAAGDAEFPCAGHDCCCSSKADCDKGCCCFPRKTAGRAHAPKERGAGSVRVRLIGAIHCAGQPGPAGAPAGGSSLGPHLMPVLGPRAMSLQFSGQPGAFDRRLDSTPAEIPEPVPKPAG